VLGGALDFEPPVLRLPPHLGGGDLPPPGEVPAGDRVLVVEDPFHGTRVHDLSPGVPRPGPDIHDPVGGSDRGLVVLHHYQRVAEVPEPHQRLEEPPVVSLVEPDRRLVEDVQHPHEPRPDLGGQPDPLGLPARQGRRGPVQRQVVQADVHEEPQPSPDLLEEPLGDEALAVGQLPGKLAEEVERRTYGHRGELGDVQVGHCDGE
jgi:hypothetical protein